LETNRKTMDKIVALCKNRGFIFPGSEIYGGLKNTWDYGPLGVELKNNIKAAWWKKFIAECPYNVGLDTAILMNPDAWVASGHVGGFNDPLIDCRECKERFRADSLIESYTAKKEMALDVNAMSMEEMEKFIQEHDIHCPSCGNRNFTGIRQFNLMFKTYQGVTRENQNGIYLRPETAQGIFINFKNVLRSTRSKMPMGIGQIGKSFRNEITPGNFIFRTREFEQMELEFFCHPKEEMEWFHYWKDFCKNWLLSLGLKEVNVKMRDHSEDELSHYSNATTDIEYKFPFGWGELWGVADRTDFDLKAHMAHSGENFEYHDPMTNEKYVPYCIEPSLGADRVLLAFLCDAYDEETLKNGDTRKIMHLHPAIAPYQAAVLPLQNKLAEKAESVYHKLNKHLTVEFDVTGSIGKRYRRQDEIGTPYCITIDFDTLADETVTIRERDTMEQIRLPIDRLAQWLVEKTAF